MTFWAGSGRGDSPSSNASSSHARPGASSSFFLGSGSGDDEEDGSYGLFDKERLAYTGDGADNEGNGSSALGLTSMNFWDFDAAGATTSNGNSSGTSSSQGMPFVKQEDLEDGDSAALLNRMLLQQQSRSIAGMAGAGQSSVEAANSPDGMDFDELVAADAFA